MMVRALHAAGIEVIIDVIYNYTAEEGHLGPTLCYRGIDNASYYRLKENKRFYHDYAGKGNTLNARHPRVLQMIMDSLRYWVQEMHVDGFKFDFATILGSGMYDTEKLNSLYDIILQDPIISRVKLIAGPWDGGPNGYQLGNFPVMWTEWNAKFRDSIRNFWNGNGTLKELANRMTGSPDLYSASGRHPHASVNFITSHEGFTLEDLVSHNKAHNDANKDDKIEVGQQFSWNCGVEGLTTDVNVLDLRSRQKRNLFATLMFSIGVPMIRGGDELSHSQLGNNNAYCQDNEITWYNWDIKNIESEADIDNDYGQEKSDFVEFVKLCTKIRNESPNLQRHTYKLEHRWINPGGHEMREDEFNNPHNKCIGILIPGSAVDEQDTRGKIVKGDTILILINAHWETVNFLAPYKEVNARWVRLLDTTSDEDIGHYVKGGDIFGVPSRSFLIFILEKSRRTKQRKNMDEMKRYASVDLNIKFSSK